MNSLPTELLIQIFAHGSASDAHLTSTSTYVPFPICISHVCAHWRSISLSIPHLWTTVVSTKDAPYFPTLRLQLERAGSYPLDLYLDFNTPESPSESEPSLPLPRRTVRDSTSSDWIIDEEYGSSFWLLDADKVRLRLGLLTVSRNVRTYHLTTNIYEYIVMALCFFPLATISTPAESLDPSRAAALEDVKIEYRKALEDTSRWGTAFLPINDEVAPRLRELRLRGLGLDIGGGSLVGGGVGVTGLTTLELRDTSDKAWFSVPQLRATLASNPALTTLALENAIPHATAQEWEWAWPVDEEITLASLEKLVFAHGRISPSEHLLRRLKFPNLHHLEIDLSLLGDDPADDAHDALIRLLISRIGPSLRKLRLEELHCSSSIASTLLSTVPNLRVLMLNFHQYEDADYESNTFVPWAFGQCLSDVLVDMAQKKLGRVWELRWRPFYVPKLEVLVLGGVLQDWVQEMLRSRSGVEKLDVFIGTGATGARTTNGLRVEDEGGSSLMRSSGAVKVREIEWKAWRPVEGVCRRSKLDLFDLEMFLAMLAYN